MIHNENPFGAADDPTRRLRGRLGSGVTVITSGVAPARVGLTVSSLIVVEGEPGRVVAAVGPNSDLFDTIQTTGCFIVHLCSAEDVGLADVFAGVRPSPGGLFAGLEVDDTAWGPSIGKIGTRAYCSNASIEPFGWSGLLIGEIDRVEFEETPNGLIHYRGRYRRLSVPQ